ncbi:MAG TPA: MopE-related protein, partial [Kofleriaceae bacterium]|nr:MopE-related protein [Kofleriaceae bacterium]
EYGPCTYQGPQEACNQIDDDCDGQIDESLVNPPSCDSDGACAGATAACTASGWRCVYGPDVSVDASGVIVPETTCDGLDNDCDGQVDEAHPQKGTSCDDGLLGVCASSGTFVCNAMDPGGPVMCNVTHAGQPAGAEQCDALDNDCDGVVDDGAELGGLPGQEWTALGTVQMMTYEASRPDASAASSGAAGSTVCSRAGVQPWTNVTHAQAQAACSSVGARLCSEQEWHRACAAVAGTAYPVVEPAANNGQVFLEAEDFASRATGTAGSVVRAWVPDQAPAGYSGIGALRASPNTRGRIFVWDHATS